VKFEEKYAHFRYIGEAGYLQFLEQVIKTGTQKQNRTTVNTRSVVGGEIVFDISNQAIPLLNTKFVAAKLIISELLWILRGNHTVDFLKTHKNKIWDEWATAEQCAKFGRKSGDLGPVYGVQWRYFGGQYNSSIAHYEGGVDQIAQTIELMCNNPESRRIIVTAWHPQDAAQVTLPPCHTFFQIIADKSAGTFVLKLYMRSADLFLGVPFNIVSYSILGHILGIATGLKPEAFIVTFGDAHVYENAISAVQTQLERKILSDFPTIAIRQKQLDESPLAYIESLGVVDFQIIGYSPQPKISAEVVI